MITTFTLGLLLISSAAPEATSVRSDEAAQSAPKAKPQKICKNMGLTGSRIGKRQCKTKEQWEQAEYAAELTVKGKAGTTQPPQMDTNI